MLWERQQTLRGLATGFRRVVGVQAAVTHAQLGSDICKGGITNIRVRKRFGTADAGDLTMPEIIQVSHRLAYGIGIGA